MNEQETAKNKLSEICGEGLMLIIQLRSAREYGDPTVLRQRIKDMFDKLERHSNRAGIPNEDFQNAKFAMIAFLDESIVASEWSQKEAWLSNPLQLELYNRFDAGEEFFVRLEQLLQEAKRNEEVLKVYYHCMAQGFRGKYQLYGQENLRQLIDETYQQIRRLSGKQISRLSPHGKRRDEIVEVVKREVPVWVIGVGAASIGFLFYVVLTFLISGNAGNVVNFINQLH